MQVAAYPLSKLAAEAQLARWREIYPQMDCVAVRFSDVWGAMDRDTGARGMSYVVWPRRPS